MDTKHLQEHTRKKPTFCWRRKCEVQLRQRVRRALTLTSIQTASISLMLVNGHD